MMERTTIRLGGTSGYSVLVQQRWSKMGRARGFRRGGVVEAGRQWTTKAVGGNGIDPNPDQIGMGVATWGWKWGEWRRLGFRWVRR